MKKKTDKRINPFIRALVSVILIYVVYNSFVMLSLCFFSETAVGVLDSYDSRRDDGKAGQNQSRMVSKSYHFFVDGREYKGSAFYSSDEAWPRVGEGEVRTEKISYLTIFPFINKPAMLTDHNEIGDWGLIYYILRIPMCVFLFHLVNGWNKKRGRKKRSGKKKQLEKSADAEFCAECGGRLQEGARFCTGCGTSVTKKAGKPVNAS